MHMGFGRDLPSLRTGGIAYSSLQPKLHDISLQFYLKKRSVSYLCLAPNERTAKVFLCLLIVRKK